MDKYFVTSDGAKLHYTVTGTGSAPVVILPGMGMAYDNYAAIAEKLGSDYTFYVLDYRCHGESEDVPYGYHIERLAVDFKEMLQDAGLSKFSIIAHSMGNTVAWAYFEIYGQEAVTSYVLEEEAPILLSDPCWTEEESKTYRGTMDWPSFMEKDASSVRSEFMCNLFHDHVNRDWRQEIKRISVPTLILMGTTSHYGCSELHNWLNESIKGSDMAVLEGGHNLHVDAEEEFITKISDHLRKYA